MYPGPFSTLLNNPQQIPALIYCNHCSLYFTASIHYFPHDTFNLCFQQDRWDWQPHCTVGAKYFGWVVCRFHVVADTGEAPDTTVSGINLLKISFLLLVDSTLVSYWGKDLLLCSSSPSSWGFPTVAIASNNTIFTFITFHYSIRIIL